jgi:hypothetical protein
VLASIDSTLTLPTGEMLPIPTADVASLVLVTVVKPARVLVTVTDKG